MKKIENGYYDYYFLTEEGELYDGKKKIYVKPGKDHTFRIRKKDNSIHKISLKTLYKLVYNKIFCIDNIDDLKNEQWKDIADTENKYFVSNLGRIKSYAGYEAKILKPTKTKDGYERLDLFINKQRFSKFVHVLVANAFLPKPDTIDLEIHHKDFNRSNNVSENLEFIKKQDHKKLHTERKLKEKNEK